MFVPSFHRSLLPRFGGSFKIGFKLRVDKLRMVLVKPYV
jgi:hypothetical protein